MDEYDWAALGVLAFMLLCVLSPLIEYAIFGTRKEGD